MTNDNLSAENKTCSWLCGDPNPGHKHYAVVVRDSGHLLGRLTSDGSVTNRNLFAVVLSKARAEQIAAEINEQNDDLTAKAILF